jgi:hypothetical protein
LEQQKRSPKTHSSLPGVDPAIHAGYRHAKVGAIIRDVSSDEREFTMDHRVKPGGDERIAGSRMSQAISRARCTQTASHPRAYQTQRGGFSSAVPGSVAHTVSRISRSQPLHR